MRKAILVGLLTSVLIPSLATADDNTSSSGFYGKNRMALVNRKWSIQAIGWHTDLDGHIKVVENENPARGQKIDLKKDTKDLDKENLFGLDCLYKLGTRSSIEFNMINVKHDGKLNVGRMFKGKNYTADTQFKIRDNIYDLLYNYRLSHNIRKNGQEKYHFSGILGVKVSDMDFGLSGQVIGPGGAINEHNEYSKTLPVPYVGLEYGTFIGKMFYFKAIFRCMEVNVKDYDAGHYDYNAVLSYRLSGDDCLHDVMFDVGYRYINYDVEGKGDDIELEYKGPYMGFDVLF
jgi:hypothetical protein